jgi:uncharacterized protein with HEPN domain
MPVYRALWRLDDMRRSIEQIRELLKSKTLDDLRSDWILRAALERLFQIVCEAARHVPEEWQQGHPEVPWRRVIDLGNQLRHAYHRIEIRLLWAIYTNDLDQMDMTLQRMIAEYGPVPDRPDQIS